MSELRVDVRDDGVALLTLDAPDRRNALSVGLCDEIVAAVDAAESDGARAIVVTGAGKAFCAGATLDALAGADADGLRRVYDGFLRIARSPLPSVAAVNGAAVGAGANLALACDLRIVAPEARFIARFLELGIAPGGGHTWMLERLVGPQTAAAMVLFGEELDGAAALRCGLAWACRPAHELVEAAAALARTAAGYPPGVVARVKATLQRMPTVPTHEEAVEVELEHQLWSVDQPAFRERLAELQARIRRASADPRP